MRRAKPPYYSFHVVAVRMRSHELNFYSRICSDPLPPPPPQFLLQTPCSAGGREKDILLPGEAPPTVW